MNLPPNQHADPGLSHLEGRSFAQILVWLERALRGQEVLPTIVPDEFPEGPILRRERALPNLARQDLRDACKTLVSRFVQEPQDDTPYVQSLLHLATGFKLAEICPSLHRLTIDEAKWPQLPADQMAAIVSALLDLKAPLSRDYWIQLSQSLSGAQKMLVVAGLLGFGFESAFDVIGQLPNDEATADSLYVVLQQHSQLLPPSETAKLAQFARLRLSTFAPEISAAISEWIRSLPQEPEQSDTISNVHEKLDSALAAFNSRHNREYRPVPASARLVAAQSCLPS